MDDNIILRMNEIDTFRMIEKKRNGSFTNDEQTK